MEEQKIPPEAFEFVKGDGEGAEQVRTGKSVGFFRDAWGRFSKNKSSIAGLVIIAVLLLFSLFAPLFSRYSVGDVDGHYKDVLPKAFSSFGGFWDGTKNYENGTAPYQRFLAMGVESGRHAVVQTHGKYTNVGANGKRTETYSYRQDTYNAVGYVLLDLTKDEYAALMAYQDRTGRQVIYPRPEPSLMFSEKDGNYWYKTYFYAEGGHGRGEAMLDGEGNFVHAYRVRGDDDYTSLRIQVDPAYGVENVKEVENRYRYALKNQTGYSVRVCYYDYYIYRNGFEPKFLFGANDQGQDLFVCIASGTRFSLLLAVGISAINLFIGGVYGAIEGYYGGVLDLTMERFSEILSGVPFMVVAVLFQLHLAKAVGAVGAFLFAFVLTGWIGTASTVRMQFYRYKKQEYVLASRTLGARDGRLILRHIFPNALGTVITGAALYIPSVIFSETSLSYLGIVSLDDVARGMTSLGTLLSRGQAEMSMGFFHPIFFPSLVISLLMISFNLFGNGLRDAFNPSLRGVEE